MLLRLFLSQESGTPLGRALKEAIARNKSGATFVQPLGVVVHLGPNGPFVDMDEYRVDYPAWIPADVVWQITLTSISATAPRRCGLYEHDGTTACLSVALAPTVRPHYSLTVTGATMKAVTELHAAILKPGADADGWNKEEWAISA